MTASPTGTLQLLPFRAVRYNPSVSDLAAVIAPPYDVIDDAQQSALEAADPHNVVRLILPRDPGIPGVDRYAAAAQTFEQWLDDETLLVDDTPALYVYQQTRAGVVLQRGLLGAVVMQPLDGGVILPHENVRTGPVEDRLALMRAMRANPEPIFLLYDGGGTATASSASAVTRDPLATAVTSDGITHELWSITDPQELAAIAADLAGRTAMIADGHHRYTTYGYLRDELHAAGDGAGPWDAGLTLLVDASVATPDIRAIHRVVPNLSLEQALTAMAAAFRVVRLDASVDNVDDALALLAEQDRPRVSRRGRPLVRAAPRSRSRPPGGGKTSRSDAGLVGLGRKRRKRPCLGVAARCVGCSRAGRGRTRSGSRIATGRTGRRNCVVSQARAPGRHRCRCRGRRCDASQVDVVPAQAPIRHSDARVPIRSVSSLAPIIALR